jgi:DNA-binding NarL/FixJ family response regulator
MRSPKAKPHLASVPVIFMTGLSETEHIVRGLDAGGVDYVTKPIVPDELLARIRTHLAGARSTRSARTALDAMGRTLLAVSADGRVLWCTPQAGQVIAALAPTRDGVLSLPPEAVAWLRSCLAGTAAGSMALKESSGPPHTLTFVGGTAEEILLRLSQDDPALSLARLRTSLPITAREAEVLFWLSRGKSSRDIGEILGLSHRTVTKHLEAIYAKLGVENRTAASIIANRYLQGGS